MRFVFFLSANMSIPINVETLKNMNADIGKYAVWYVRVLDPKIIHCEFHCMGETIHSERFECVLVSKDPAQYMLAAIPFSSIDRTRARKALDTYKDGCVLEITTPAFDMKARQQYNGCPVKSVLLLIKPTTIKHVPPTNTQMLQHPAKGLHVVLDVKSLVFHMRNLIPRLSRKTCDFVGKFQSISHPPNRR